MKLWSTFSIFRTVLQRIERFLPSILLTRIQYRKPPIYFFPQTDFSAFVFTATRKNPTCVLNARNLFAALERRFFTRCELEKGAENKRTNRKIYVLRIGKWAAFDRVKLRLFFFSILFEEVRIGCPATPFISLLMGKSRIFIVNRFQVRLGKRGMRSEYFQTSLAFQYYNDRKSSRKTWFRWESYCELHEFSNYCTDAVCILLYFIPYYNSYSTLYSYTDTNSWKL